MRSMVGVLIDWNDVTVVGLSSMIYVDINDDDNEIYNMVVSSYMCDRIILHKLDNGKFHRQSHVTGTLSDPTCDIIVSPSKNV